MNWASNALVAFLFGHFSAKEDQYNKDPNNIKKYTVQYVSFLIFGSFCILG